MELIKIVDHNGKKVVSARELHAFLELDKSQISRWLKTNITNNDFLEMWVDYTRFDIDVEGQYVADYAITLDTAKRLALKSNSKKGEDIRTYFIECEKKLQQQLPQTYKEALIALIAKEEEKEQLQLQVNNLDTVLDNLLDWVSIIKVAKHNKVHETAFNWHLLKDASKQLGYEIKKAASPRFGYQNLYHMDAFKRCYPQFNYNLKK